jgi:hypothetical protein
MKQHKIEQAKIDFPQNNFSLIIDFYWEKKLNSLFPCFQIPIQFPAFFDVG